MDIASVVSGLGRPIVLYPNLARAIGRNESIFVCQFLYWDGKGSSEDGFIYKTADEIEEETSLSYKEQLTVKKNLKNLGILESYEKRLEHKMFYKINKESLSAAFSSGISRNASREDREGISEHTGEVSESSPLYTEITSESTTENTFIQKEEKKNENELENNTEESQVPNKGYDQPHPSVTEAVKHISPSPTLLRQRAEQENSPPTPSRGPANINIDERPFEQTPPTTPQPEMLPFLVYLIGISHEIGCELRWNNLQEHIKNAVDLWGEKIIEKEFRNYGSFIATLTNKNVDWHKFKMNKLDKIPTLQQIEAAKQKRNQVNTGPQSVKAIMPSYDWDAYQYMREMENGAIPINQGTLGRLQSKLAVYPECAMKSIVVKFLEGMVARFVEGSIPLG